MSLKITKIQKDGDAKEEYILLEATENVNISAYAVIDKTFNKDGKVSNVHKHFYRFPSKTVKKGEYVSLRTGKGTNTVGTFTDGSTVHRFYWGSDAAFWNDNNVEQAELLKVETVAKKAA
ncbi:hypothetical protein [Mucilaginibacter lacusdianchii]|uniref:hypothetical protein n=1 Tax=Mucilaginibacter lacusdianchii TaxID=2684211 RepID=UPI00131DCABD|nr:hypothetical protein [Mucilaginibacter sp. JXJ CY 39]